MQISFIVADVTVVYSLDSSQDLGPEFFLKPSED